VNEGMRFLLYDVASTDNAVELAFNVSEIIQCEVRCSCCSVAKDSGVLECHVGC
jgi:hypothetical protein